jgi:hypothetical protein
MTRSPQRPLSVHDFMCGMRFGKPCNCATDNPDLDPLVGMVIDLAAHRRAQEAPANWRHIFRGGGE